MPDQMPTKPSDPAILIEGLRSQIHAVEQRLADLKSQLASAEESFATSSTNHGEDIRRETSTPEEQGQWPLSQDEYRRYGRQMIVPELGLQGQLRLKKTSILIIGLGGLGAPASLYLAAAGPKRIGLVDPDTVSLTNLHRQIIHRTSTINKSKVSSAETALKDLNSNVEIASYATGLFADNAASLFSSYDIILDCTDNPATRYLISDTAICLGKPVVSASALRTEGQLTVFNYPPRPAGDITGGPCYRCVWPVPPPPESVTSCADGGILGPVVGVMGVMQALEAIKIITSGVLDSSSVNETETPTPSMLLFSAYASPQFRNIKLRRRRKECKSCSAAASISLESIEKGGNEAYTFFCGSLSQASVLPASQRISVTSLAQTLASANTDPNPSSPSPSEQDPKSKTPILIDVRDKTQFSICNLRQSINIPFSKFTAAATTNSLPSKLLPYLPSQTESSLTSNSNEVDNARELLFICRMGNDSQIAAKKVNEYLAKSTKKTEIETSPGEERRAYEAKDVKGGFRAWIDEIDAYWPDY